VAGIIHRARAGGERIEVDGASVDKPNLVTELRSVNAPRIGRMPRLPQLHTQGMCMDDFFSDDQPDACGVGLMDLKLSSCRYIVGEVKKVSRYCGEPKSHGSYCAHHGSLCYVSPGEVKRRLRLTQNLFIFRKKGGDANHLHIAMQAIEPESSPDGVTVTVLGVCVDVAVKSAPLLANV
jgi:hypothetical protein